MFKKEKGQRNYLTGREIKAIAKANAGDYTELQKSVQQLLSTAEAQKLLKKLGG